MSLILDQLRKSPQIYTAEDLAAAIATERAECAAICDRIAAGSEGMLAFGASKCAEGIRDGRND